MARNDEREAIVCTERAGGTLRTRMAGKTREFRVRDDLSIRHAAECADHIELERRPPIHVELHVVERDPDALEVRPETVDELLHLRYRAVTRTRPFRRYGRPRGWWASHPTLGGGFTRTRACTARYVGDRSWKLVPDQPGSLVPQLSHAPALGRVRDGHHRHRAQAYNRAGCPPRPAY